MSLHGIAGPQNQSWPISGKKCTLARPLITQNLVAIRQEVCKISATKNLCSPKKWAKIHQALWVQMINLDLVFQFVRGRYYDNQIMLEESNECGMILPAFFALAFKNELDYHSVHYRYMHINSSDDQAISDINLVGFWPVPPELTQINCVQQVSFSTRVCLSTFPRWQHCYVSLLLAWGWHCSA